jgi:hypothetical protein
MQSTFFTGLSRIVSRSLVSRVVVRIDIVSQKRSYTSGGQDHRLTTAVSGFPKDNNGPFKIIDNSLKGRIGEDAYFITGLVIGVADGVGGWRDCGVDPGLFSSSLMESCERLVKAGSYVSDQPVQILASGYAEMQKSEPPIIGSSTACLATLNHDTGKLYTANLGDSGFLVVRDGKVVQRWAFSQRQLTLDCRYLTGLLCDNLKKRMFLQNFFPDTIFGNLSCFSSYPHHSTILQPNNFIRDRKIKL